MKKVIVTGANGHLGFSIVKQLKERGYTVRAAVRDTSNLKKIAPLKNLGVEVVEADLLDKQSLAEAFNGMDGLFQVAANFNLTAKDPVKEVIQPNIDGTRNSIVAAHETGVKKIVYTSSIAAVGTIAAGEKPLDESSWNINAIEPYAISKTHSEEVAWELAEKYNIPLVTVLPGTILGPNFHRLTSSLQLLKDVLDGKVPMAMPMALSYVDVRDVALAHILVYENESAHGRYIATGETLAMSEVLRAMKSIRPEIKASEKVMPTFLVRMLPGIDFLMSKLTRAPRQMKGETIKEYLNRIQAYSSERLKNEFQWNPRSVKESLSETIDWMSQGAT